MTLSLTTRHTKLLFIWLGCAATTVLGLTGTARAELGGSEFSVQLDQARASGELRTTSYATYDCHEITTLDGALIREFADRSGQIFAVTWHAHGPIDLHQLLGAQYEKFAAASLEAHRDLHHTSIHLPDLVVDASVIMRTFAGRAYLPNALPVGVAVQELR
ncbi:MAG TPA: DUF2844 domain-containing protein [Steroidobacteraceae bacterium]